MGKVIDFIKDEVSLLLRNKKSLASLLILGIIILSIYLFITFRQSQIIKSRASNPPITFVAGDNVKQKSDGGWVSTTSKVTLSLTSPLGPPAGSPTPTPTPTSSPSPASLPLRANLTAKVNGVDQTISSGRTLSVSKGTTLNFVATTQGSTQTPASGAIEIRGADAAKSAVSCEGGTVRTPWCTITSSLSGSPKALSKAWTFNTAGEYFVVSSLSTSTNVFTQAGGCTSTPWCSGDKFVGTCHLGEGNCSACSTIWTNGSCGESGYIKLTVTDTSAPPSAALRANLTVKVNGQTGNISSSRTLSVPRGASLEFSATAENSAETTALGAIELITTAKTAPPCGAGQMRKGTPWCTLATSVQLSSSVRTFYAKWDPDLAGEYYVATSLFKNGLWQADACTSTPWCQFNGSCLLGSSCSTCSTSVWTRGSCGENGYIKLVVTD